VQHSRSAADDNELDAGIEERVNQRFEICLARMRHVEIWPTSAPPS